VYGFFRTGVPCLFQGCSLITEVNCAVGNLWQYFFLCRPNPRCCFTDCLIKDVGEIVDVTVQEAYVPLSLPSCDWMTSSISGSFSFSTSNLMRDLFNHVSFRICPRPRSVYTLFEASPSEDEIDLIEGSPGRHMPGSSWRYLLVKSVARGYSQHPILSGTITPYSQATMTVHERRNASTICDEGRIGRSYTQSTSRAVTWSRQDSSRATQTLRGWIGYSCNINLSEDLEFNAVAHGIDTETYHHPAQEGESLSMPKL
jgi:hypothetical protein